MSAVMAHVQMIRIVALSVNVEFLMVEMWIGWLMAGATPSTTMRHAVMIVVTAAQVTVQNQ
jgi:hypothetical protein